MKHTLIALACACAAAAAPAATFTWTGGAFVDGVTAPNPLAAGDVLALTGNAAKSFSAAAFTNLGRVDWTGGGLSLANGAAVTNAGLWDVQANVNVSQGSGATATFTNDGTLRKSAGAGTSNFGSGAAGAIAFVNRGVIDAQAGTLSFNGSNRFEDGTQFSGAGSVVVASASSFAGAIASQNLLLATTTSTLLTGQDARLAGQARWSGGALAGQWTVTAGSTLTAVGTSATGNKAVSGSLAVDGTLLLTEATGVSLREGATLTNRGLVELRGNLGFSQGGGAEASFVNEGLLAKTAGTGTSSLGGGATSAAMGFVNRGTIDVQTGTLLLAGHNRFEDGSRLSGAGTVQVGVASTFAGSIQSQNLLLAATATTPLTGEDARIAGAVGWTGGRLEGQWTFAAGGTLQAQGGSATGNKAIGGTTTVVTNEGLLTLDSATGIGLYDGARVVNRGTLDLRVDENIVHGSGAAVSLVNEGLLVKTAGTGTSTVGGASPNFSLVNTGRIEVRSGTLRVTDGFRNAGTLAGTGTLRSTGGWTNDGTIAPGLDGTGTLTLAGGALVLGTGSVFAVDLGAGGAHDLLAIGGSARLDGTLALNCVGACEYAVGERVTIATFTGATAANSFAGISLHGFGSGAFSLINDNGRLDLLVTQAVTAAVPEPAPWLLLLGGVALMRWRRFSLPT